MSAMVFGGLEGSNPLAFLAAVGAFRLCAGIWNDQHMRMRWIRSGGWRPEVTGVPIEDPGEFCNALAEKAGWAPLEAFEVLGENLTVGADVFSEAVDVAVKTMTGRDRRAADFAAAFGCEILQEEKKGRIYFTDLCFITGSGHQDFLGTARALARNCLPAHFREALFGPWRHADAGLSMRWDPDDAKEYALQWGNPSSEGVSSVWGATCLAFEALPFFPAVPCERGLRTTGFATRRRAHEFTWPIWTQAVGADTVRSLLSLQQLQEDQLGVSARAELQAMGIGDVFRAQRVRIPPQGANFKVSFRPARAI
jgi:hypothetical protein